MVDSMTRVAVISTNDRIYGVNKSLELLDFNPIRVEFGPAFNTEFHLHLQYFSGFLTWIFVLKINLI